MLMSCCPVTTHKYLSIPTKFHKGHRLKYKKYKKKIKKLCESPPQEKVVRLSKGLLMFNFLSMTLDCTAFCLNLIVHVIDK